MENKEKYLVSACLAGVNCRFDGVSKKVDRIKKLYDEKMAVLICPEILGGLPVPRPSCEIRDGKVININGEDKTKEFIEGANRALEIAKKEKITKAILKSKSPSCGSCKIYDGTFKRVLIEGDGITSKLLKENGIEVITEEEYLN